MATINDLISLAKNEVGYLEKKTNAYLDEKTKNSGYNNYTKYARDLDNISNFYNGKKNGYSWCSVFVAWCFVKTFGVARAKELLNYPSKSLGAGVGYAKKYYVNKKQYYSYPQVGDCIFFRNASGGMQHIGLVCKVNSTKVYTIEGNTSSGSSVISNGGAVCQKSYKLNYKYIDGYGRPSYSESEKGKASYKIAYINNVDYEGLCFYDVPKGKVTKVVPVGTEVKVYEASGTWSRTDYGWTYSAYLKATKPKLYYTTTSLNVRKSYSTNSGIVSVLKKGTPVQIYKTKNGWAKVSPDVNAWCYKSYLK